MVSANNSLNNTLENFCVAGVNYHKSDISTRSKFSLSENQVNLILRQAPSFGFNACFALSTCNRTEIYGICTDAQNIIEILCNNTQVNKNNFLEYGFIFQGLPAIEHLFKVASGLDSQIIGDYEILAQLKLATKIAKQNGCINTLMERIINFSLQASKEIKTKTKLSSGTVSVSYAAVEIIKEKITNIRDKKFLVAGTGKFGKNVAKNLKSYFPGSEISFTNRTDEKAMELANLYEADFIPYQNLPSACNDADIIIVSSSSDSYIIPLSFFTTEKSRLILDLSIPQNVDPSVNGLPGVTLFNVDEVSAILDKTILIRQAEVQKALVIIENTLNQAIDWFSNQPNNLLLNTVKAQLYELNKIYFVDRSTEGNIHQIISSLAIQLKYKTDKGCQCISALGNYLQPNMSCNSEKKHQCFV